MGTSKSKIATLSASATRTTFVLIAIMTIGQIHAVVLAQRKIACHPEEARTGVVVVQLATRLLTWKSKSKTATLSASATSTTLMLIAIMTIGQIHAVLLAQRKIACHPEEARTGVVVVQLTTRLPKWQRQLQFKNRLTLVAKNANFS